MTGSKLAKNPIQPQADAGADLTHVYTLIHSFLKERSHTKAASALKKAVHGVITLDDSTVHDGPTLQKILEEWRELKAAADAIDASSSDSGSESSDESSSDDDVGRETNLARKRTGKSKPSDSSGSLDPSFASYRTSTYLNSDDSGDDSDGTPKKAVTGVTSLKDYQRDSSKTLSSADDADSNEEPTSENDSDLSDDSDVDMDSSSVPAKERKKRKTVQVKKPDTSSSDATSSSSSDSDSNEDVQLSSTSKHKAKSNSSSDSSSSSDSDSDEDTEVPTTKKSERDAASSSSDSGSENDTSGSSSSGSSGSSSSSSSSEDELAETPVPSVPDPDARATKKLRANKEGTAVITATAKIGNARASKASRKPNVPFQRVNVQAVNYHDEALKDNSFESRGARSDDYGARANRDLVVTRGDGFRKEKNKKKRGSYQGGDITLQSHSFKFED